MCNFISRSILQRILLVLLIGGWLIPYYHAEAQGEKRSYSVPRYAMEKEGGHRSLVCFTDKKMYIQGEKVSVTLTNISDYPAFIIDRKYIDAGVGTIERKDHEGQWKPIELYAAATAAVSKILKQGESHTYIWRTVGYNRSDTIAKPGIYRIRFSPNIHTNEFQVK
jgi:hypothetical protein